MLPRRRFATSDFSLSTFVRSRFEDQNKVFIEEEKDWTYHFKKTDFSEYSEAAVRHKMTLNNNNSET